LRVVGALTVAAALAGAALALPAPWAREFPAPAPPRVRGDGRIHPSPVGADGWLRGVGQARTAVAGAMAALAPDREAPREIRSFGGADPVFLMAFSPGGEILAAGGRDEAIALWQTATGHVYRSLQVGGLSAHDAVWCIAFAPAGTLLAAGDSRGRVALWDTATGQPGPTLTGGRAGVTALAFGPEGRTLSRAATGTDGSPSGAQAAGGASGPLWDTGSRCGHWPSPHPAPFSPPGTAPAGSGPGTWRADGRCARSPSHRRWSAPSSPRTGRSWPRPGSIP
jgi:WD40 repeat protein